MYRRIMLRWCWWLLWSVPSKAKYRSAGINGRQGR
jgi:hypothetical protein